MTEKINYEDLLQYDTETLDAELTKRMKELKTLRTNKARLATQIPALRNALYEVAKRDAKGKQEVKPEKASKDVEEMLK